jgi:phosphoglycerol transferase MdoB-like AlkP superfamily enzyme
MAAKRSAYANEIQWVDQQAIAMVDAIRKAETRPSVIIVFGDHGSRLPVAAQGFGDSARVTNLFAALTPGQPGLFGSAPTLVNVFPTLLDSYLGGSVPLLPNRAYDYYPKEVEVPLPGP